MINCVPIIKKIRSIELLMGEDQGVNGTIKADIVRRRLLNSGTPIELEDERELTVYSELRF